MTLPPDKRSRIRQLSFGEHWKVGTIAAQLGVHPDAVRNAIVSDGFVNKGRCRPSALDPYVRFISETLERYPRLTGTRVFEMVRERGYPGSVVQVRPRIRLLDLRPQPQHEAFSCLQVLPGEQVRSTGATSPEGARGAWSPSRDRDASTRKEQQPHDPRRDSRTLDR